MTSGCGVTDGVTGGGGFLVNKIHSAGGGFSFSSDI